MRTIAVVFSLIAIAAMAAGPKMTLERLQSKDPFVSWKGHVNSAALAGSEFIETVEREDICERLGELLDILALPGIKECDDLPAERDW